MFDEWASGSLGKEGGDVDRRSIVPSVDFPFYWLLDTSKRAYD